MRRKTYNHEYTEPLDDDASRSGEALAERLRDRCDTALTLSRGGCQKLHVPLPSDPDKPLCYAYHENIEDLRSVDVATRPPGYAEWCKECAAHLFLLEEYPSEPIRQ